jgi:DNA polymerase I-like protein with 3'-5' exonuclease and polymerase domains
MLAATKVKLRQTPECTLLLNHALTGRMEDLKTLVARELGIDLPKEHQLANWSGDLSGDMLSYAARDAATTLMLAQRLRAIVEEHGALRVYRLMRDAQQAVVEMELAGIGFDADQHRRLLLDAGRKQSAALWELRRCGLEDPNSAKATASWLERFASHSNWPRTKSGQLCTDAATLRYLARLLPAEGHEGVEKLLQYRDSTKLLSGSKTLPWEMLMPVLPGSTSTTSSRLPSKVMCSSAP